MEVCERNNLICNSIASWKAKKLNPKKWWKSFFVVLLALGLTSALLTSPASAHDQSYYRYSTSRVTNTGQAVYCGSQNGVSPCSFTISTTKSTSVSRTYGIARGIITASVGFSDISGRTTSSTAGVTAPRGKCLYAKGVATQNGAGANVYKYKSRRTGPRSAEWYHSYEGVSVVYQAEVILGTRDWITSSSNCGF